MEEGWRERGVGRAVIGRGSLRGGGVVHAYGAGVPTPEILWCMRLRHMVTLEHYLQEEAASAALRKLVLKDQNMFDDDRLGIARNLLQRETPLMADEAS